MTGINYKYFALLCTCVLFHPTAGKTSNTNRFASLAFSQNNGGGVDSLRDLASSLGLHNNFAIQAVSLATNAAADTEFLNGGANGENNTNAEVNSRSSDGRSQCLQDVERLMEAIEDGESWSLEMIDSWATPGPSLRQLWLKMAGNYDQCRDVTAPSLPEEGKQSFDGNYCVVMMSPVQGEMGGFIEYGTCMPDTCSEEEISQLATMVLSEVNATDSLVVALTECRDDDRDFSTASILAVIIFSIIAALMVLGTIYDLVYIQVPKWEAAKSKGLLDAPKDGTVGGASTHQLIGNDDGKGSAIAPTNEKTSLLSLPRPSPSTSSNGVYGVLRQILLSFSVWSNAPKILSTKEPPGAIGCIHGLRFFSMTWVCLLHIYMLLLMGLGVNVYQAYSDRLSKNFYDIVYNSTFSVDTFFTVGGFLVSYLKSKELMKKGMVINWKLFYFHRFWRLTPPYMLSMLFFLGLMRFFGSGAMWSNIQPADKENCEDHWWTNILYINNLVHPTKMCLMQSWYLANDMQFYVISPLLFVPFYYSVKAGIAVCLGTLVASWTTIGILANVNDWYLADWTGNLQIDRFKHYYVAPYCRIGPFIIGILAGYLLAANKGKIKMSKRVVAVGWTLATILGLLVVFGIHGDVEADDLSSTGVAALYIALAKSTWGLAISWLILACASGYGGPVNAFLSWKPFIVLGRLSYMTYLIHISLLAIYFQNLEQPFVITDMSLFFVYLACIFFSLMVSFVMMLAVEAPMVGLERTFLSKH